MPGVWGRAESARPSITVAVIAALGLSGPAPAAAAGGTRDRGFSCAAAAGTTVAQSTRARIYSVAPPAGSYADPRTFGCLRGVNRRVALDIPKLGFGAVVVRLGEEQAPIAFAGDKVAVALYVPQTQDYVDCDYEAVAVYDLRTGKRVVLQEDGMSCTNGRTVERIVMRPGGSVAWASVYGVSRVQLVSGRQPDQYYEDVNLDDSRSVDRRSLRLRGTRLTWRSGGRLRAATLR
jgi:hypothetical protein